jgi:predicted metal-dependent phosphoesterase TrpH
MALADPHCHTTASDGMVDAAGLVDAAVAAGLDLIAVTDHDTMAAVAEAQARGQERGLAVVAGQEVTTRWPAKTHVVGWFLERPVRAGMSLADTVAAIHDQGGLAVIPHPFMPTYFASCQQSMLARLLEARQVDGIELVHTAPTTGRRAAALEAFYLVHRARLGAAVGASDSHFGRYDLGLAVTEFEGRSAEDFRQAVAAGATRPVRRGRRSITPGLFARQQVRALLELPARRLTGRL